MIILTRDNRSGILLLHACFHNGKCFWLYTWNLFSCVDLVIMQNMCVQHNLYLQSSRSHQIPVYYTATPLQRAPLQRYIGYNADFSWIPNVEDWIPVKITKREPPTEELQHVCEKTQYKLTKQEKKQLSKLLHRHKEVFQLEREPLGGMHLVQHDKHMTGPPIPVNKG